MDLQYTLLTILLNVGLSLGVIKYDDFDEGSGEVIVTRNLICYQCSGDLCPAKRYSQPIRHLIVRCQACYKEWLPDDDSTTARKCFHPTDVIELDHYNATETGMCGYIERNQKLASYCFCYTDYCNKASVMGHSTFILLVPLVAYTLQLFAVPDS